MMKSKLSKFLFIFFISVYSFNAQDFLNDRWGVGLNLASVLYSAEDGPTVGGRYIAIIPGISVSKYLGKKMTLSVTFSKSIQDTQKYLSSDFNLSYDVFNPDGSFRPYVLGGIGLVNLLDSGMTFNIGGGGTLWIAKNIGLNGQLMYKVSTLGSDLQRSHFFSSAGIIYSFSGSGNKRLWER